MQRWKVGDVTITQLVEQVDTEIGIQVLPDAVPEQIAKIPWLRPHFATPEGAMIFHIQALIIESQSQRIVVDTCIGNDKNINMEGWANLQGPFLKEFADLGFAPDSIDRVICTHLHVDHVGWNTRREAGKWVPTFPNARYLMVKEEFDFWNSLEEDPFGDVFNESVRPVMDAGLADLVKSDHGVNDEIRFESTPGHTPGHISVHISSAGEEAVITGDMIHHPCQMARPGWQSNFDADKAEAQATRAAFLKRYADRPVLILGTHFAGPVGGKIVRDGDAYRLDVG